MISAPTVAEWVSKILGESSATVIDVGARWGIESAWWRLAPLARVVGFDPDPEECARLNALSNNPNEIYVPLALGKESVEAQLYVTEQPACSSLYRPLPWLGQRYPDLQCTRVVRTESIRLETLDAWAASAGVNDISFMKLDTQGSELDILEGAQKSLQGCVGLEIETEFSPLYEGQPVFSDLDRWLRERGFVLWRIESMCHYGERTSAGTTGADSIYFGGFREQIETGNGRLFWGNAVYFRDYAELPFDEHATRRLLVLAALLAAKGDLASSAAAVERVLHEDTTLTAEHRQILEQLKDQLVNRLTIDQVPSQIEALRRQLSQLETLLNRMGYDSQAVPGLESELTYYRQVGPLAMKVAHKLSQFSQQHPRLSSAVKRLMGNRKVA